MFGIGTTEMIIVAIVVVLLLFNGWMGGEMVFRHRVAVLERGEGEP